MIFIFYLTRCSLVQTRLIVGDESNLVSPAWEVRDGFTHESPDQECIASDTTPDKNLLAYNLAVYMYAASVSHQQNQFIVLSEAANHDDRLWPV